MRFLKRLAAALTVAGVTTFCARTYADPVTFSGTSVASYTQFGFENITNNYTPDQAQYLSLKVYDLGGGQVGFRFLNNAPTGSGDTIGEVYFYDGALLGSGTFMGPPNTFVAFNGPASTVSTSDVDPYNLPGFNPPNNSTLHEFYAADSQIQGGGSGTGVTAGGYADVEFTLQAGVTFSYMLGQLTDAAVDHQNPGSSSDLYIGVHLKSLTGGTGGDSDSFLASQPGVPGTAAPLPSTAYAGFGLLGLVGLLRLRKGRRIVAA